MSNLVQPDPEKLRLFYDLSRDIFKKTPELIPTLPIVLRDREDTAFLNLPKKDD